MNPVLDQQAVDARKFTFIVRHENTPEDERLGGDEEIVGSDQFTPGFESSAQIAISHIDGRLEREDVQGSDHRFDLGGEAERPLLHSAVSQFGRDDDARTDVILA